jgi:hypothetical protein
MRLLSVAGYVILDEMREDDDQFRFRSRGSQLRTYRCNALTDAMCPRSELMRER